MLINSKSVLAFFYPIATQPIFTNIVKGERRIKYRNLFQIFFIPNRSLYSTNIAKGEGRKPNLFEFYAKPHPVFYKYIRKVNIRQKNRRAKFFLPINFKICSCVLLSKYSETCFRYFYPKPQPIFYKFKQKRAETRNGFVFSALSAYKKLVLCSKANLFIF